VGQFILLILGGKFSAHLCFLYTEVKEGYFQQSVLSTQLFAPPPYLCSVNVINELRTQRNMEKWPEY
jgi:hypothetical protein